jgi:nitrile hydratase accessory protein
VLLHERGHFAWREFAGQLAAELAAAAVRGEADHDGSQYYTHWLHALEMLLSEKGLLAPSALG